MFSPRVLTTTAPSQPQPRKPSSKCMVFVFILALIPPSQIKGMNLSKTGYILLMLVATLVISIIPLVIYQFKKPSWMPGPRSAGAKEVVR